jgi:hypothetical protein
MSRQIMDCCIASLKSIAGFDIDRYYAQLLNFVGTPMIQFYHDFIIIVMLQSHSTVL